MAEKGSRRAAQRPRRPHVCFRVGSGRASLCAGRLGSCRGDMRQGGRREGEAGNVYRVVRGEGVTSLHVGVKDAAAGEVERER